MMNKKNKANAAAIMKHFNDKEEKHVHSMQKGGSLNAPYENRGKVVTPAKNVGEVSQSQPPQKGAPVIIKEKWNNK